MDGKLLILTAAGLGCGLVAHSQHSPAAGFAVLEQSAKRMGSAYAGSGAVGDDASEVWYNPAAATRVGPAMQLGLHYIEPSFEFEDAGSPGNAALLGNSRLRDDGGTSALVPNFAYTALVFEDWYAGITANVPFGLSTEYRDDWVGRYRALESEISSVNLNPFVAHRFSDAWSLGLGFSVNYTDVSLSQAVDFAGLCAELAGGLCPNGAVPGAGTFDGRAKAEGDDVGYGYNLGLLWSPTYRTRVSLAYRSEIDLDLTGDGTFSRPQNLGGLAALGPLGEGLAATFTDSDVESDLTLPDTASFGLYQLLNVQTALLLDVTWTDWSNLDDITIQFDNPQTPTSVERLDWEDTWRYSLGLSHEPDDTWTLRAGLAYDESPVPNARVRTPRLPDNDRTWLTLGASRTLSSKATMDISYSHVMIDDTDIEWQHDDDLIRGEYDSEGNNLSIALNVKF